MYRSRGRLVERILWNLANPPPTSRIGPKTLPAASVHNSIYISREMLTYVFGMGEAFWMRMPPFCTVEVRKSLFSPF
jgi:hypothetical protein